MYRPRPSFGLPAARAMALAGALGVFSAAPAAAAEGEARVLLFQPEGSAPADARAAVDAGLRAELSGLTNARLLPGRPGRPARCAREPACSVEAAVAAGADLIVLPRLDRGTDGYTLEVRLLDREGALRAKAGRSYGGAPPARLLRGLALQLFEPDFYTGTLLLTDVMPGEYVSIDRLPVARVDLVRPLTFTVGRHQIFVEAEGRPIKVFEVEVRFNEQVALSLRDAPASAEAAASGVPVWPAVVAGAIAGASALVAGAFLVDSAYYGAVTDASARGLQTATQSGANPHLHAGRYVGDEALRLSNSRLAVENSLFIAAVSAGLALCSTAVAGALTAAYLAPSGGAERSPAGE